MVSVSRKWEYTEKAYQPFSVCCPARKLRLLDEVERTHGPAWQRGALHARDQMRPCHREHHTVGDIFL